jgi:hypothetical protein
LRSVSKLKYNIVAYRPLLGYDRKTNSYITVATRQRSVNSNRQMVFSVRSLLDAISRTISEGQCSTVQGSEALVRHLVRKLQFISSELFLSEAGT